MNRFYQKSQKLLAIEHYIFGVAAWQAAPRRGLAGRASALSRRLCQQGESPCQVRVTRICNQS